MWQTKSWDIEATAKRKCLLKSNCEKLDLTDLIRTNKTGNQAIGKNLKTRNQR